MKRFLKIAGIVLLGLLALVFFFISPIVKYVIEKNSVAWTGRTIRIESLFLNIFGGGLHMEGFRLMEQKSDNVFIHIDELYCNISINSFLRGQYVIEKLHLTQPRVAIVQRGDHFNFDDLVLRFTTPDTTSKAETAPVAWFIEDYSIRSAIIQYRNFRPAIDISVIDIAISGPPVAYTDSAYSLRCDFGLQGGGRVRTYTHVLPHANAYSMILKTDRLNLNFLLPYLKEYMKVKSLDGLVSTDLLLAGHLDKSTDVFSKGTVTVDDFSLVDTTGEKLAGFHRFFADVDTLSTPAAMYDLNALVLTAPYVRFGMYTDGYNFDRILTGQATDTSTAPMEDYSNIFQMMAGYIRDLSREYLLREYRVDKLQLTEGHIIFTDYTLEEKFHYDLDSMSLVSENFNSRNERILVTLASRLNKSGVLYGTLNVNPDGYADMEIDYSIRGLLISDINPYSKYYVATPFMDGVITYTNTSTILDNQLKSVNKLLIEHIRVGDKVHSKTAYNLPIKLAVAILRDPKGNIDLEIPVEGDLNDPNYRLGKVIWQVLKNLVIKAATAPYNLLANAFGGKEADYKEVQFQYLQKGISADQHRILDNLAKVTKEKPDVHIEFVQVNNREDEAEQMAVYRAKKEYLGYTADSLSPAEHKKLMELSAKDSLFNLWLDRKLGSHAGLTSTEVRCLQYCGMEKIQAEVGQIMELRNAKLQEYMMERGVTPAQLKIHNAGEENQAQRKTIPRYLVNFFVADGSAPADSTQTTLNQGKPGP